MKTLFTQLTTATLLMLIILFSGCQEKDLYDYDRDIENPNPLEGITPPSDFGWGTVKSVKANIPVTDELDGQYNYLIEVFAHNPLITDNKALSRGIANKDKAFTTEFDVPNGLEYVYFKQTDPKGRVSVIGQPVQSTINYTFGATTPGTRSIATRSDYELPNYQTIPDDATEVTGSAHKDWFQEGKSYKITGDYSGGIYHSGRNACALYISGTWTPPASDGNNWKSVFNRGLKVVIMPGGKIVSQSKLEFNGTAALEIMPGGTLECKELYLTNTGYSSNQGTLTVSDNFKFNAKTNFYNTGTITIGNLFEFTNNCTLTNKGYVKTQNLKMTSAANVINECTINIEKALTCNSANSSFTLNKGTIIAATMEFNNTKIQLNNGSMLKATEKILNIWDNKYTNSGGDQSLVKSPLILHKWGGAKYSNTITLEGTQKMNENAQDYQPGKSHNYYSGCVEQEYDKSGLVITTTCGDITNPGNKGEEPKDPPLDPIVDENTYTYLFEDQWPLYHDYDMNDIVLKVKNLTINLDEDGKGVDFSFDVKLEAVGAAKHIAIAAMLDRVTSSTVSSVTYSDGYSPVTFSTLGNGTEGGQNLAVLPLIDDAHLYMGKHSRGYINTEEGSSNNIEAPSAFTVTVKFASPVDIADLTITKLNVFIVADINQVGVQNTSRKEIHVGGYQPTDKAVTSIFGSNNDGSSLGTKRYYISKDNLVWGIFIPAEFSWPREYVNIKDAYTGFEGWVTSGGDDNVVWWETPVSGKVFNTNTPAE